jgi:hypothetical protein
MQVPILGVTYQYHYRKVWSMGRGVVTWSLGSWIWRLQKCYCLSGASLIKADKTRPHPTHAKCLDCTVWTQYTLKIIVIVKNCFDRKEVVGS